MVSMDFSVQANACVDWVLRVMKPEDYLIILNVLNLKAPSKFICFLYWWVAYAHDIVINDRMKKESQEKLDEFNKTIKEKGFLNIETVTARGEPSKISFSTILSHFPSFLRYLQLCSRIKDWYDCNGKKRYE